MPIVIDNEIVTCGATILPRRCIIVDADTSLWNSLRTVLESYRGPHRENIEVIVQQMQLLDNEA